MKISVTPMTYITASLKIISTLQDPCLVLTLTNELTTTDAVQIFLWANLLIDSMGHNERGKCGLSDGNVSLLHDGQGAGCSP